MEVNASNFIVIGHDTLSGDFWAQERINEHGEPGGIKTFFDGKSKDVKKLIKSYTDWGYDIKNIIYNGRPAKDLFEKKK